MSGLRAEDVKEALDVIEVATPENMEGTAGVFVASPSLDQMVAVIGAGRAWLALQEQTQQIWWCAVEDFAHPDVPSAPWGSHSCAPEFGCGWMHLVPVHAVVGFHPPSPEVPT